ncbi:dna polymerase iv [Lasius niger]|uniref:Dna polymerase iv n=1 Tax=Lasius niger TaxID=67767 RepID=A0A0J7KHT8_LASNI|nr:dna polymerase iv [Lasius niger]
MADEDPLNPRHSGFVTIGLQNPISIPMTSMIASTELSSLKKEYKACMWKVTVESALHNIESQEAEPLKNIHVKAMEGDEEILVTKPGESGVFRDKHPENYIPQ